MAGVCLLALFAVIWFTGRVPADPARPVRATDFGGNRFLPQAWTSARPSLAATAAVSPEASEPGKFDPHDLLSWGGAGRNWFACMLEKKGYPSGRWGCQTPPWQGDPCKDEFLYTGPPFPDAMAVEVSPLIQHVELKWDAGKIARWEIAIKPGSTEEDVRRELRLPAGVPSDLMSIEVRKCPEADLCVVVKALDRIYCPGHRSEEE
jgi:hypothetical protein